MARYREAVCRLCRREGGKLFLKGDKCFKAIARLKNAAPTRQDNTARRAEKCLPVTVSSFAKNRK
jgi:small subunit ribosomal protein S4